MLSKSPAVRILENHDPADAAFKRLPRGLTGLDNSAKLLRDASGSRDPQSAFRTLTGVRFRPVDESASCIGAGEL